MQPPVPQLSMLDYRDDNPSIFFFFLPAEGDSGQRCPTVAELNCQVLIEQERLGNSVACLDAGEALPTPITFLPSSFPEVLMWSLLLTPGIAGPCYEL